MKRAIVMACLSLVALPVVGCSSDGDILPKKERFTPWLVDASGGMVDASTDSTADAKARDPDANCVKPGTPTNERGVGGYCEPGRGDCASDAGPRFCTADFRELTPIGDYQWFCSTLCMRNDECGTGAVCATGDAGSGCTPVMCTAPYF